MNKDKLVEPMVVDEKGNIYYSAKIVNELYQKNEALKSSLMIDHHKIHELADVIDEVRKYTNDKLFDDYTYCSYEDLKQNINEILDKVKEKQ